MEVVKDVVNREIVVIEVLSSELSNGGALSLPTMCYIKRDQCAEKDKGNT
jgi:hypothetical protein